MILTMWFLCLTMNALSLWINRNHPLRYFSAFGVGWCAYRIAVLLAR